MTRKQLPFTGPARAIVGALALVVLFALGVPQAAQAALQGTAGNAVIRNTVSVAFNDANGNAQTAVTAAIDVTVNTVEVAPTVLAIAPSPGSTDGVGATQAYTVTIRTNSNGPAAISFATSDGTFTNIAAGTAPTVPSDIFLGSTIVDPADSHLGAAQSVAASGGTITFAVPNDGGVPTDSAVSGGSATGGGVNGLTTGDTVYLTDGTNFFGPFAVGTVTEVAVGTGATAATDSIQLVNNSASAIAFTPAAGWMIVEAKDVTVTVTQGAITDSTAAASWVTTVTATMGASSGNGTVTTNALSGHLTVDKYVRNVTTPVVGTTSASYGGNTYYKTGVSGKPTETLEYLLVITNNGTGGATAVTATDAVPTYTDYVANSTLLNGITVNGDGSASPLASGLLIDANGSRAAAAAASGALSAGQTADVTYQVTIQ